MKENSIEEALEKLSNGKKIKMYELLRTFKRESLENFVITRKKYVDVILSDYKRVLKENEELLEVKVSASAHNRILELEKENEELKQKLGRKITEEEIIKLSNELIRTGYGADKILKREKIDSVEQLNYERYQFYMKNFEKTPDKPKK